MKKIDATEEFAIYGMLFSLGNRIQAIGDKEFSNITLKQHFMMIALDVFEQPPTLKEVGELIGCSYQNVKRMADCLQKEEYLTIKQDPCDKRKLLLVPTGKFQKLQQESKDTSINFIRKLYKDIPRENLKVTLETLIKMDMNIGGKNPLV